MSSLRSPIVALRGQGLTVAEVARRLGVAQSTVHYHLRRPPAPDDLAAPVTLARARTTARSNVTTRDRVGELLHADIPRAEIARRLGVSKSTVSYHARRLGETVDERCAQRYDWRVVQAFHDDGNGARACIREFGFSSQTWHAAITRGDLIPRSPLLPLKAVFAAGTQRDRGHLKKRLLAHGLRANQCECCGLWEWRNAPLSLALHHVNGDRNDNRLDNLQLLCPNCHSQTENFAGRRRPSRPDASAPDPPAGHDERGRPRPGAAPTRDRDESEAGP